MTNYLAFGSSVLLAVIAAYFSVVGLSTIFAGAFWSVVVMGGALEIAKLVTAAWLHLNWNEITRLFRYYLAIAVVVLMLITSLGIFGFLSKAHIDSQTAAADNSIEIQLLDAQQQRQQNVIDYVDSQFEILDNASNEWIEKGYITRALQERERQKDDRQQLKLQQEEAAAEISKILLRRSELEREAVRQSAEIGPIKYVADMVYGDSADDRIDDAARILILLIIFVFDPVAVLLLVASSKVIANRRASISTPSETKEEDVVLFKQDDMYVSVPKDKIDTSFNTQKERDMQRKREFFPL